MRWVALFLIAVHVLLVIALLVVFAGEPWYIVDQSEQVVITRFGNTVGRPVTTPGLKTKIPFIDRANFVDSRVLDWDGAPNEVPTSDKHFIFVDTFAHWRIVDPLLFYQRVQHERGAQSRLDDILDGETRNIIARHDLIEVVRSSNREFEWPTPTGDDVAPITAGRAVIEQEILDAASARAEVLGIEVIDFRLKRTTYVDVDRRAVHKRMIAERLRLAEEIRAKGEAEAARIRRAADRH